MYLTLHVVMQAVRIAIVLVLNGITPQHVVHGNKVLVKNMVLILIQPANVIGKAQVAPHIHRVLLVVKLVADIIVAITLGHVGKKGQVARHIILVRIVRVAMTHVMILVQLWNV